MQPLPNPDKYRRIKFMRNTVSAGNFGTRFQQHIEPAGRYMIEDELPPTATVPQGWVRGSVTFQHPLVLLWSQTERYDDTSWKAVLYRMFKATGRALSKKIRTAGYDGIVTVKWFENKWTTSEIVDLTGIS